MSNGHGCCILAVCCPPGPRSRAALAHEISQHFGWSEEFTGTAQQLAEWLFDRYDLVPKGVGEAIVNAYGPHFAEHHKTG